MFFFLTGCSGQLEKLDQLSPEEIASLILDPKVGALESVGVINQIFDRLQHRSDARELDLFFIHFVYVTQKVCFTCETPQKTCSTF